MPLEFKDKTRISPERVRELFEYDPSTGHLIRKPLPRSAFSSAGQYRKHNMAVGKAAGSNPRDKSYYRQIRIGRKFFMAHRLVWVYFYGKFPEHELDHINRDRQDNHIENLRECTRSQNSHAGRPGRPNKTGFRGVSRTKYGWQAVIDLNKKRQHLGTFPSLEEASKAYQKASVSLLGEFHPDTWSTR